MQFLGLEITRRKQVPAALVSAPVRSPSWLGVIRESFSGAWSRDVKVDDTQTLLAYSAVYACISRISNDISMLRPMLMEEQPSGIWIENFTSPVSPVIKRPNRYQNRIQFLDQWITSKLIYGNAYILKERDSRGVVVALYPLDPRYVTPMIASDGAVYYQLSQDFLAGLETDVMVPASEVIHDRMKPLWHPLVGVGPLYACGLSATQGRKIQTNSSKFFENMSRPSGQLTAPGTISDETAARLKEVFEREFSGEKIGRLFVGGDGLKYEPMAIPADQAQLIEQQKWTIEDVARCFLVPLYKLGAGTQPNYSNVAALNQDYYTQCLQHHIESIETHLSDFLPAKFEVWLDVEALLRMDHKTRAETNDIKMKSGTLSPNEARLEDNRAPVEGGESPYLQQQNYSLLALSKRDARDDPFATGSTAGTTPALPAPAEEDDPADAGDMEGRSLLIERAAEAAGRLYLGMQ